MYVIIKKVKDIPDICIYQNNLESKARFYFECFKKNVKQGQTIQLIHMNQVIDEYKVVRVANIDYFGDSCN